MFHALLSIAAATPVPTIIEKTTDLQPIVKPIAQTPAIVLQLAALVATYGAGLVVSLFHLVAKAKIKWLDGNVNRVLVLIFGVTTGLVSTFAQGDFKLDIPGVVVAVVSTALALFGQGTTFNVHAFLNELGSTTNGVSGALATELAIENPTAPVVTAPEAPVANF